MKDALFGCEALIRPVGHSSPSDGRGAVGEGSIHATEDHAHAQSEPYGQPLQVVPVGKLVERVKQDDDPALAHVIAEPLASRRQRLLKSRFGSCPSSCCSAGQVIPLRSSSSKSRWTSVWAFAEVSVAPMKWMMRKVED